MLDTKTLTEETIKECRENEEWLKTKVEEYAPKGTTCKIEELSVSDEDGNEFIFCEVTITCNKRKHHFNYYAGTQGVTLVERLGGKKGEYADGAKMGRSFEMEFYIPSKDDVDDLQEFLEQLGDYVPYTPKKPKAEQKKKKIFIVSGFHFHPYEQEHDIITEVFDTREKAAKCIFDILTDTFPDDADDFTIDGCMWGNEFCNAADEEVKLDIEEFTV